MAQLSVRSVGWNGMEQISEADGEGDYIQRSINARLSILSAAMQQCIKITLVF